MNRNILDGPSLLIGESEIAGTVARAAQSASWGVKILPDPAAILAAVRNGEGAAVLIDLTESDQCDLPATIRAKGGTGAMIPILACAGNAAPPIDEAVTPATLAAALARWRPDPAGHPGPALARMFGEAPIAGMIARLRPRLADILGNPAPSVDEAHALAGIAGTLGFAEVHRHWIAVSHGDMAALADAHAATRKAVLTIDRGA